MKQARESRRTVSESATIVGDLADLRAFCEIVDRGSITDAARALRESKATVSRRLARLEAAVGATLVARTTRQLRATEDGVAYRERLGEVLELLGAANDAARHRGQAPSGLLRVTSGPEFNALLAPIVTGFAARYPAVRVEMLITQASLDLDGEGVDVALRVSMQLPDSALIAHKILPLDVAVVASPAYVKAHGAVRTPEDLTRHRCLWLRQGPQLVGFRHRASGELHTVPITPHLVATEMNFLVDAAACGGGIMVAPELAVRSRVASGELVRVLSAYDVGGPSLYLMHRASRFIAPKVRAFREFVLEALRPPSGGTKRSRD